MSNIPNNMIDPADAVMCLIDHQSGLFQLVRDIDQPVLRNHAIALAKVAKLAKSRLLPQPPFPMARMGH